MAVYYAFFSYAHADSALEPELYAAFSDELEKRASALLVNAEVKIWKDIADLRLGEKWDARIAEAIDASHMMIVMLSPKWLQSDYCRKEYAAFQEVEKSLPEKEFVFPLLVRELKDEEEFFEGDQRTVYDSLMARQFKEALADEFRLLGEDKREALVAEIAAQIKPKITLLRRAEKAKRDAAASAPAPGGGLLGRLNEIVAPGPGGGLGGLLGGLVGGTISTTLSTGPSDDLLKEALEGWERAAAPKPAPLPPHNLPLQTLGPLFMGRDAFMERVADTLKNAPAVVAHGMGGVGKTRLAIEYGWRRAADYSALLFVSAETPELLDTGLAGLATTLGLPEQELPHDPPKRAAVLAFLEKNPGWLLILDNVDDARAAQAVAALLPRLSRGKTLITARYDGFPVPVLELDVLALADARDFLRARTEGRRREAADDTEKAAELAGLLGGLALALEQAGAFITTEHISFDRYLAYWRDERARVVEWFDKTVMGANRDYGLAAAWKTSLARLSEPALRLLQRCAFLAPEPIPEFLLDIAVPRDSILPRAGEGGARSVTDEGAEVPGAERPSPEPAPPAHPLPHAGEGTPQTFDARAALRELYAYALAAPTEVEGRYRQPAFSVHRLVQDFVRGQMGEERKAEMLREALSWIDEAFVDDPTNVDKWGKLDPLGVHGVYVAHSADKAEISEPTASLMNVLGSLFYAQAKYDVCIPLFQRALALTEVRAATARSDITGILSNLGAALFNAKRLNEAEHALRRALSILDKRPQQKKEILVACLINTANLLLSTKRHVEAEELFRRSIKIVKIKDGPKAAALAPILNGLALVMQATNRHSGAITYFKRALVIDETNLGPRHPNVAIRLINLAGALRATHNLKDAEPLLHRGLSIHSCYFDHEHPLLRGAINNYRILLLELGHTAEEADAKVAAALRGE